LSLKVYLIALVLVLLFSVSLVIGKEEEITVEKENLSGEHSHAQSVKPTPLSPPKTVDYGYEPKRSRSRRLSGGRGKRSLFDNWRDREDWMVHPWRKMNKWVHSMFESPEESENYEDTRYPLSLYDRDYYDKQPYWYDYPSFKDTLLKPQDKQVGFGNYGLFAEDWMNMIPFRARFDRIASSVNEKDDRYIFKVINVPDILKKENLSVKLSNEGGRDILDITSKLETAEEKDFFEKKYIFPKGVDRKSIKAKFDDKERILTVEVFKKKGEDNLIDVKIE